MQEVSGAVTLQQVPEAHEKKETCKPCYHPNTFKHTYNNSSTHTRTEKCKDTSSRSVIPLRLFSSSRFNWGFEPGSCLSHCDELKIALWQVSESPAGIRLYILCQMGCLARGFMLGGLQTQKKTSTRHPAGHVRSCSVSCTCCKGSFCPKTFMSLSNRQRLSVEEQQIRQYLKEPSSERERDLLFKASDAIMQPRRRVPVDIQSLPLLCFWPCYSKIVIRVTVALCWIWSWAEMLTLAVWWIAQSELRCWMECFW